MKSPEMQLIIWTRAPIGTAKCAERFLEALAQSFPEAFPPRWGECEPLTIRGSTEQYAEVIALWSKAASERSWVLGHSRSVALSVNFMLGPSKRPHEAWFWFPQKLVIESKKLQRSVELFDKWLAILNADFGLLAAEGEWVSKNVLQDYEEEDGSVTGWRLFANDITKGLPGVYWCTYLGGDIAQWLGEEAVAAAPWPHVEKVGKGYLLRRSEDPSKWNEEKDLDDKLLNHLGRKYFFDISDLDRKVKAPPLNIP
jgi:hypothetical protein